MKIKNIFMVLALSATVSLSSCESFLEVPTIGKSTIETFFAELDGLRAAGRGLHRTLAEFYDDEYVRYPEIMGDMVDVVRLNANEQITRIYDYLSVPADDAGFPRNVWRKGYDVISNANNILYYGEPLYESFAQNKAEIDMIFAQALFIRALVTFDLCQVYGHSYIYTPDASHLGVPV
ncbi:MAG: RagB/SusD family nutrient uptake outer membrane protein, partial [Tidjanibacter sp.]|nr:RagB/SusD family nutrient uptake outer membrane protein [Tidjanibacter sp.]